MQLKTEFYRFLRRIVGKSPTGTRYGLTIQHQGQAANDLIRETLLADGPCMIGRFGSNELDATLRAYERQKELGAWQRLARYIRGESGEFWWDNSVRKRMSQTAGFFPATDQNLQRFGQRILDDCCEIDVLGSWCKDEWRIQFLFEHARTIDLIDLEPFRHTHPWSSALAGKRVLVIHPFEESIQAQYEIRELLFDDPLVLPEFELLTLKSVQSNGLNDVPFADWFEALDYMCRQVDATEFDIAIVGAGAYGLPLAAYIKRMGKKAIHLGGATQLLFGIRGSRWDDGSYDYVYNEHWCRPLDSEKPKRSDLVEQSAYW